MYEGDFILEWWKIMNADYAVKSTELDDNVQEPTLSTQNVKLDFPHSTSTHSSTSTRRMEAPGI